MYELRTKFNEIVTTLNQHIGVLYRNEKAFADMVYTNSVRISVMRRIIREQVGIDDLAFDALVDQELARRKEEEARARAIAEEKAKSQTATEKAKELGAKVAKDHVATMEDIEFGGDFGEEKEPDGAEDRAEASDQDRPVDGGLGSDDDGGAVDEAGPDPGGVQPVDGGGEEGQPPDPV